MSDEPKHQVEDEAFEEDELEGLTAEELPERAAMSVITPPGDSLGPPPTA